MTRRQTIQEKIMSRVRIDPHTGCWIWTGPTSGNAGRGAGYPRMSLAWQTVAVHTAMSTNEHGYIPGKKETDNKCRNRFCVNPNLDYLEMITRKRNSIRREEAKRLRCEEICS